MERKREKESAKNLLYSRQEEEVFHQIDD